MTSGEPSIEWLRPDSRPPCFGFLAPGGLIVVVTERPPISDQTRQAVHWMAEILRETAGERTTAVII